jgi:Zn-dependent protease
MKWAETRGLSSSSSLFVPLPVIAVGYFTTLMLHESGHALAAHSFQMKMLSFSAGPFQWRKQEGSWKFKITASRLFGGSVNVVPTNPHQPRWQDVCMIFAGPAANLCSGLLFVWAALHAPGNPWQAAWFYLSFTASFSFIVAFSNLLPFRTKKGSYSDGARILQLFTNSPVNEFHQTLHRLQSTLVTPLRFRDLDPDAFRRVADRYATELTGLHLRLCAVGIFEDSGRIPEARSELAAAQIIYDTFTIDLPVPLHTVFIIDHAYLNRDAAAARLWWSRMKAKKAEPLTVDYWLARTALLWIEGRLREAEEAWQKADSKAQKLPRFGGYEFDRYRCAILREELDQAHVAAQEASYATAELRAP